MPWSIQIDEFASDEISQTTRPDGPTVLELKGRYSAHHIVRIPQLPFVELHAADSDGDDGPLLQAETVSFTLLPNAGDHRRGAWSMVARADLRGIAAGTRLTAVLTDSTRSLTIPSTKTLVVH